MDTASHDVTGGLKAANLGFTQDPLPLENASSGNNRKVQGNHEKRVGTVAQSVLGGGGAAAAARRSRRRRRTR